MMKQGNPIDVITRLASVLRSLILCRAIRQKYWGMNVSLGNHVLSGEVDRTILQVIVTCVGESVGVQAMKALSALEMIHSLVKY